MVSETAADRWRLVRGADIPRNLRHLLLILQHYQRDNATAWCTRIALAQELDVCDAVVSQSMKALENLGVVSRVWTSRNARPSREYAIQYSELAKRQRSVRESSGCDVASVRESSQSLSGNPHTQCEGILTHKEALKNQRKKQRGASLPEVQFPESLNNEEFRRAWSEWVEFRREIKKKLTPSTVSKQLTELATWGSVKSIQAINNSIRNGWQGLFDPEQKPGRATGDSGSEQAWQTLKRVLRTVDKTKAYKNLLRQQLKPEVYQAAESVGFNALFSIDQFNETEHSVFYGNGRSQK
jgi:DNA-binding HxlR family transcriptional regulator